MIGYYPDEDGQIQTVEANTEEEILGRMRDPEDKVPGQVWWTREGLESHLQSLEPPSEAQ